VHFEDEEHDLVVSCLVPASSAELCGVIQVLDFDQLCASYPLFVPRML